MLIEGTLRGSQIGTNMKAVGMTGLLLLAAGVSGWLTANADVCAIAKGENVIDNRETTGAKFILVIKRTATQMQEDTGAKVKGIFKSLFGA